MFGDAGAVLSLHWFVFGGRLSQRPITSDEFVPISGAWFLFHANNPLKRPNISTKSTHKCPRGPSGGRRLQISDLDITERPPRAAPPRASLSSSWVGGQWAVML